MKDQGYVQVEKDEYLFQSPRGEVVMKVDETFTSALYMLAEFQSPRGEVVMKGVECSQLPIVALMFQSPRGEVVMKACVLGKSSRMIAVSVPSRGSGDERVPN